MKILLDTNFILTSVKQKVDFPSLADELFDEKVEWIVPVEVVGELETLSSRRGEKIKDKLSAQVSIEFVKILRAKKIKLGGVNVDDGIVDYLKKHEGVVLATLDKELKKRVGGKILSIRGTKGLGLV